MSKIDQSARRKKTVMYNEVEDTVPTERKFKGTQYTAATRATGELPRRTEYSPSPMKPSEQENVYKYDYSSMVGKMALFNNSQADLNTNNGDADKDNATEIESIRPTLVSWPVT